MIVMLTGPPFYKALFLWVMATIRVLLLNYGGQISPASSWGPSSSNTARHAVGCIQQTSQPQQGPGFHQQQAELQGIIAVDKHKKPIRCGPFAPTIYG